MSDGILCPLLNESDRDNRDSSKFKRICQIMTPVVGLSIHFSIASFLFLNRVNILVGIWSLATGIIPILILVVECLDWNSYWTDRRTTRNVCSMAFVMGMAGFCCSSARFTQHAIARTISDWSIHSKSWMLVFDLSIIAWSYLLYVIAMPRNTPIRPLSPLVI